MAPSLETPSEPLRRRYSCVAIVLHWLIALLILVNFALGWTAHVLDESDVDQAITNLHKSIGIIVLLLSVLRLLWRLGNEPPALPEGMSALEQVAARAGHWLLYAFMIAVPVAGWWMSSAFPQRHPLTLFGLVELPFLPVRMGLPQAFAAHDFHRWLAVAMILLVAGHTAAALRHHFLLRDDVLSRMSLLERTKL